MKPSVYKKIRKQKTEELKNKLKEIQKHIERLEREQQEIIAYKLQGAMIRARRNWLQNGEKATKFFLGLEKQNYSNKNRYQLRIRETIITDIKEIVKEQDNFYENLYKTEGTQLPGSFFKGKGWPKISEKEKESLEQEPTEQEIEYSLKLLKKDKVSGTEGLPPEFYRHFWKEIKGMVVESDKAGSR